MGHHSSEEMSEGMLAKMKGALKAERDDLLAEKLAKAESPKFGATGKFPMGVLDKSDEGEIAFGITSHRGKVIINFGKPVAWLGMDANQAIGFATLLLKHANTCRNIGDNQKSDAFAKEHS